MDIETLFSEKDREEIKDAVRIAEATTSGEIVPTVVAESARYEEAPWRGATLGALVCAATAAVAYVSSGSWGIGAWWWLVAPALVGAALGFLLGGFVPFLRRALIHPHDLTLAVERRAAVAFVEHEVFDTRDRTGILIFLSLFERRVVVLGDAGINAKVEQHEWDGLVKELAAGIKRREPAAALVKAIGTCGELLRRKGVAVRDDDTDELPDQLRIERE